MKIIRKGKIPVFKHICGICKTEFEFTQKDVLHPSNILGHSVVECPLCRNKEDVLTTSKIEDKGEIK